MFRLGLLLAAALVLWAVLWGGDAPSKAFYIVALIDGWLLFSPVRRSLSGGTDSERETNQG